jgi:hypothetical protein
MYTSIDKNMKLLEWISFSKKIERYISGKWQIVHTLRYSFFADTVLYNRFRKTHRKYIEIGFKSKGGLVNWTQIVLIV